MAKKTSKQKKDALESVGNASKTLLANIRFMSVDNPIRTIVFTSAIPNEGKTFITSNIARAMATSGKRTLIVECDMRRRSMSKELGVHAPHGLYSVISGEVSLSEAAVATKTARLWFLDAEPHIPNPSDLLNSRRFTQLIAKMRKEFDYVVFDTPPVGTFVDAAVLGSKVDALFMVVREHNTRREDIQRAAEQLRTANVPLMGAIMNYCQRESSEYYYEYYYREDRSKTRRTPAPVTTNSDMGAQKSAPSYEQQQQSPQRPQNWSNAPDLDLLGETGSAVSVPEERIDTNGDGSYSPSSRPGTRFKTNV